MHFIQNDIMFSYIETLIKRFNQPLHSTEKLNVQLIIQYFGVKDQFGSKRVNDPF